jgi:hypothetical protein
MYVEHTGKEETVHLYIKTLRRLQEVEGALSLTIIRGSEHSSDNSDISVGVVVSSEIYNSIP